jgi:GAF domain-containing protein
MAGTRKAAPKTQLAKLKDTLAREKAKAARHKKELAEALQRQEATAEILAVISRSPTDVQPAFDAIAKNSKRLLGALSATVTRRIGDTLHLAALTSTTRKGDDALRKAFPFSFHDHRESVAVKAAVSKAPVQYSDSEDAGAPPGMREIARQRGYRSMLAVPMLSNGAAIGTVNVTRREPGKFSDRDVELLQTFAEQAVIAIENVRLFNETKEALEGQTATADILKVISSSPTDVQPVFDAIARRARWLCNADSGSVLTFDGALLYLAAVDNASEQGAEALRRSYPSPVGRGSAGGRAILTGQAVDIPDVLEDPEYEFAGLKGAGLRSILCVPMLRQGKAIGTIVVHTWETARPFTRTQMDLLTTFADQAVIAIENVRLFNETKEALEQQTAIGDILRATSSSPTDLHDVFEAVLHNAIRLCEGDVAVLWQNDGTHLRVAAHKNASEAGAAYLEQHPLELGTYNPTPRAALERRVIHELDVFANPDYRPLVPRGEPGTNASSTQIAVPLVRDDRLLGVITVWRFEKRPFTDKQVALLGTFADQAVIAIENVRLFNETKEALEQQTATAEILRVISSTPTDVQPVFDAIVAACAKLFPGLQVGVNVVDEQGRVHLRACDGPNRELLQRYFTEHVETRRGTDLLLKRGVAHFADVDTDDVPPQVREGCLLWGVKAIVYAPMVSAQRGIGTIWVGRDQVGPFSEKEIALLATFAEQAVIAIQNVRQFNETKEALERQTATAEILRVIAGSPDDVQPVFDAIVRSATALVGGFSTTLCLVADGKLHLRAFTSTSGAGDEAVRRFFPIPVEGTQMGRAVQTRRHTVVADFETEESIGPADRDLARARGFRSVVFVPLLRGDDIIGTLNVTRRTPGEFSGHQIDLLKTFTDQAVIAIENVRLFNETKEALERQTATADILKVISASPTDVQPVFNAIAERAAILCGARFAFVTSFDGEWIHMRATHGPGAEAHRAGYPMRPGSGSIAARVIRNGTAVQIEDMLVDPEYVHKEAAANEGFRSGFGVPMLRDGRIYGCIAVTRPEPGAMPERLVHLLQTFADQAVIAIENVRLFNETKDALERQTATAEILEVMSRSQSDLRPMFDTIAANAQRLCAGDQALVAIVEGGLVHLASIKAMTPEEEERTRRDWPRPPGRGTVTSRAILTRTICHVSDVLEDPEYELGQTAQAAGWRSVVSVPMVREGNPVGAITVMRRNPGPFSDAQIALLKTFADQAVIAIENVRLFNETKEALERQTATSEVLRVISSSPTDLQPTFQTILASASRLCEANLGLLYRYNGEVWTANAFHGATRAFVDFLSRGPLRPGPKTALARLATEQRPIHIPDILEDAAYEERDPLRVAQAELGGARTLVAVPMHKESELVGAIVFYRPEVRPFNERQIELLQTFADQAVIAIENVRLFNETKEALEQQTATAGILRVISSTPTDVQPVFDAIVASALRIFSGTRVAIFLDEGDQLRVVAAGGELSRIRRNLSIPRNRNSASGTAVIERSVVNIRDTESPDAPPGARDAGRADGFRTLTSAPLLREGNAIGVINVYLKDPGGLSDKQLALLKTFADQAVIAIENTRLFRELEARTEALSKSVGQLKALGEVGQAISSTLDFEKVLQTIVQRAVQLTDLDSGAIYEYEEDRQVFRQRGAVNVAEEIVELFRREPLRLGEGAIGHAGLTREPVQIPDMEESYQSRFRELLLRAGWRALLVVPLLSEGRLLGALTVARKVAGEFAPEVIDLLRTFATQSAIAIQNARLFREIEEKGRQLEVASRHKSDFLASMSHELRTPLNAILGFNEMILEGVYGDVPADMTEPLADIQTSGKHLLRLINNVLDLAKIEAGRMELALADYSVQDVVESVRTTLRPLAEAKGLEFNASVPPDLPLAHGDSGRLTQCLMNLAGNSLKFTKAGRVSISVEQNGGGALVWRVADTGIGIPMDKIGSLFTEFRQTDATIASEYGGTGLGLSITRKFVEMHGGRIWVESEPGRGSVFIFEVPLRAQTA